MDEENCYNCAYCETFENGVIRCSHIPKGTLKPCPYFLKHYRGIENVYGNQWSWEVEGIGAIRPPEESWMDKIKRIFTTILKILKRGKKLSKMKKEKKKNEKQIR